MFQMYHQGKISIENIIEKMAQNTAKLFKIEKRGFVKEDYYTDLGIINNRLPRTLN